jgi:thiamine transporter
MKNSPLSIRDIALMGMLVSFAVLFDQVFKFFQQANGGSINLAMVGLVLIALSFSWWKTWLAITIVFGLITSLLDGYFQYYVFDYFFALSGFMLISFFNKVILTSDKIKGYWILLMTFIASFSFRLLFHTISGVLYFEVDILGSFIYNVTYLVPSFLLSMVLLSVLFFSGIPEIINRFQQRKVL